MDEYQRHKIIWRLLYPLVQFWLCPKFSLRHENFALDGPCLIIPNHVCAWDPLLVAMSLRRKQVYFVASEHLFRLGFVSRLLGWLVAPIPRRKAASGADTVKACLKHLRAGRSVCLFAEGEQCWDGRTGPIFPATGKLAKRSGASLVTFKLEGGYLSIPRWGKGVRRGRMRVGPVKVYPPERLAEMTPEEINAAIASDISEDAWARQDAEPVRFRGKRRAEGIEKALFLCPGCGKLGTLRTEDDRVFCACGMETRYTETGFFDPPSPHRSIADWDDWQHDALRRGEFAHDGELLFSDAPVRLSAIAADHGEEELGSGTLEQYGDRLVCAGRSFALGEIGSMAVVQAHLLLFSHQGQYWQVRSDHGANLRKYLAIWRNV